MEGKKPAVLFSALHPVVSVDHSLGIEWPPPVKDNGTVQVPIDGVGEEAVLEGQSMPLGMDSFRSRSCISRAGRYPSRLAALSIQWCRSISSLGIEWPPPVEDNGILHTTPSPRLSPSSPSSPSFPGARTRLLSCRLDAPTMAFFPLLLPPRLHALMMAFFPTVSFRIHVRQFLDDCYSQAQETESRSESNKKRLKQRGGWTKSISRGQRVGLAVMSTDTCRKF